MQRNPILKHTHTLGKGACGGQERALAILELEIQIVSHGAENGLSARAECLFNR